MGSSFVARVVLLLVISATLSWIDFRKLGAASTARYEYGFIFLTGLLGAALGGVNDAITSSLSPEYFTMGKGLEEGSRLRIEAVLYGLQVGCSGGVVSGAILIYAARCKSQKPPVNFSWLLRRVLVPLIAAILGGFVAGVLCPTWDPFRLGRQLRSVISPAAVGSFLRVWWIHTGLYAGLLLGLAVVLWQIHQQRRRARA